MSNTRRLKAPPEVRTLARSWRCADCDGRAGRPRWSAERQEWAVPVEHSPGCPRLTGAVGPSRDAMATAALDAITRHPGAEFTITDYADPVEEIPS